MEECGARQAGERPWCVFCFNLCRFLFFNCICIFSMWLCFFSLYPRALLACIGGGPALPLARERRACAAVAAGSQFSSNHPICVHCAVVTNAAILLEHHRALCKATLYFLECGRRSDSCVAARSARRRAGGGHATLCQADGRRSVCSQTRCVAIWRSGNITAPGMGVGGVALCR